MPTRSLFAVATIGLFVLTGCAEPQGVGESVDTASSTDGAASASVDPGCQPGGEAVASLEVSEDLTAPPEIVFTEPLAPSQTERQVIVEGSGTAITPGDRVTLAYAYFNGQSGAKIGDIGYSEQAPDMIPVDPDTPYLVGLVHTLLCSTVGSRVAGVIPPAEAFGEAGAPEFGVAAGESIIFIADVIDVQPPPPPPLEQLAGEQQPAPEGFPLVTVVDGVPEVEFPEGDVPTTYAVAAVIEGDGQMVYEGATVIVHYHGVNWNSGIVFDSSFQRGAPQSFGTSNLIPGFRDGLVGHSVGSRMLITIPPALGYGPRGGTGDGRIGPDDTIFFVVDILGIQ